MHGNYLFEYAVIRLVPRVEREEFLNVGVIVYCKDLKFLKTKAIINKERLQGFANYLDIEDVEKHLQAFEKISEGDINAGEIAQLDVPLRFRWLTAARSTILQTSKVHPGLCADADETLQKLFEQLVLPPQEEMK